MIHICDLWKAFDNHPVLRGLTLTVEDGETLVILGRSGVGKSVLLKHIIGITRADRGYVEIDNVRLSDLCGESRYKASLNMGMLFQGTALFDSINIADNVSFFLRYHGDLKAGGRRYSQDELDHLVDEALRMVDLDGVQKRMPSDLSGGMKKRAAMARLMVYRPRYLLYDEPTTGLDPITAMHINELIVKTQQELQATSIVVTHDMQSALFVGDRLALHQDGKVAHIGKPDEFLQIDNPTIRFLQDMISQDFSKLRRR